MTSSNECALCGECPCVCEQREEEHKKGEKKPVPEEQESGGWDPNIKTRG